MIKLREVHRGNPIARHPALRTIWPEPYMSIVEEVVSQGLAHGPLFLIVKEGSSRTRNRVVGITGLFTEEGIDKDVFLRWHGVLPDERGQGVSGQALELVMQVARERFPAMQRLIELVPCTPYGEEIERYFQSQGFVKTGPQEVYDWVDHAWQPYAKALRLPTLAPSLHRPSRAKPMRT